jgi:hypothetical protein
MDEAFGGMLLTVAITGVLETLSQLEDVTDET